MFSTVGDDDISHGTEHPCGTAHPHGTAHTLYRVIMMPIVRNKTEKIKMASYLEDAKERLEVVIFKPASQLDLASLRDHKKYAALRILKRERRISPARGSGKSLFLCQCLS